MPDSLKIDFVPKAYKLSFDFVDISADYEQEGNTVSVSTLYRIKRSSIPASRYQEVKDFRNQIYKKNDQYIVL